LTYRSSKKIQPFDRSLKEGGKSKGVRRERSGKGTSAIKKKAVQFSLPKREIYAIRGGNEEDGKKGGRLGEDSLLSYLKKKKRKCYF